MNSFRAALEGGRGIATSGPSMPEKRPSGASEEAGLHSIAVARTTKRAADHRDGDRHRLSSEQAMLKIKRKSVPVDLVNLSGGGAMIATEAPLVMWQKVHLTLGGDFTVECAVRWIRGDRVGLEFAHETQIVADSDKRDAMLLDVLKRSFPDIKAAPAAPVVEQRAAAQSDARGNAQRRSAPRHPLIWSAEIHHNHDSARVRIRNISETGALVESSHGYAAGAEILLDLGEAGQHFAKVGWAHGDQVGIKFDRPFDISVLSKSKPDVADPHWARPAYLQPKRGEEIAGGWEHAGLEDLRESLEGFLKR